MTQNHKYQTQNITTYLYSEFRPREEYEYSDYWKTEAKAARIADQLELKLGKDNNTLIELLNLVKETKDQIKDKECYNENYEKSLVASIKRLELRKSELAEENDTLKIDNKGLLTQLKEKETTINNIIEPIVIFFEKLDKYIEHADDCKIVNSASIGRGKKVKCDCKMEEIRRLILEFLDSKEKALYIVNEFSKTLKEEEDYDCSKSTITFNNTTLQVSEIKQYPDEDDIPF